MTSRPSNLRYSIWVATVLTACVVAAVMLLRAVGMPREVPQKGSVAPHTIRAHQDAVFDLHETYAAEAREAEQSYVPIYNRDDALLFGYRDKILEAVLAEPQYAWQFPTELPANVEEGRDGGVPSGPEDGAPAPGGSAYDAGSSAQEAAPESERRAELEALVRGCFELLLPFYQQGVVGDSEFPKQKQTIRIYADNRYVFKEVADLYRFSSLRSALIQSARQFFFRTEPGLQEQVIDFVLQRLPPNLTYAKENEKFIKDISQVTGVRRVLIREGEVLVRAGHTIDTRAYYAIQASVQAGHDSSRWSGLAGRLCLLAGLLLLVVLVTREIDPVAFRGPQAYVVLYAGLTFVAALGDLLLLYTPLHPAALPQAMLASVTAVVLGRKAGLLAAALVPCVLVTTQVFDLPTLLVGVGGGATAALTVRWRRRSSAIAAGILVGVVQTTLFEACRAVQARPQTYAELWSAGEVFGGGLLSGVLALGFLPFAEWMLGRSSRGKLKVLTDFDHPLVRELRERAPGTFAHTVTLINMVELAADAVRADRMLLRAGTLFHDVGKIEQPHAFVENQGHGPNVHEELSPAESAQLIIAHVSDGLRIAKRYRLPPDVTAFIAEHHGTTELEALLQKALEQGGEVDRAAFRYAGPKPQTLETAILMLADATVAATKSLKNPDEQALRQLVEQVVTKQFADAQFETCPITQAELKQLTAVFIGYLRGALYRRVEPRNR